MDSLERSPLGKIALIGLFGGLMMGCERLSSQVDAESQFALEIVSSMELHKALNPHISITNLTQVFAVMKHGYPYYHHRELSRFGKSAGFTNSLAEKYVFFWPRFIHPYVEGELICMSTEPFPWRKNGLSRIYIAENNGNYIYRSLPEERVQTIFRELTPNLVISATMHRMPPLPREVKEWWTPTVSDRYERFVWDLSRALGQDSSGPVRLGLKLLGGLSLLVLIAFCVLFLKRKRG